ncbi:MAG: D-alanyl-D-alanine carboxypeptidase/D-alanyl-D-alanine-endopeptidase [Isosphaeraceae bacterium]|nr:D-alanyl-D-alanine carboxypeptidase/D-alanyl-D-alanine-endopeptidase [Isosphaeraceae bacterium]
MRYRLGYFVLAIALAPFVARGSEPLDARVEAVLKTPGFQHGHWGLLVVDGKTGQTIYERDADQMFAPASVTKLFSTAAALAELGADYRFRTPVVRRGELDTKTGVLHGDLILVAQGDLSLGGRTGPEGNLLFTDGDHTYANGNMTAVVTASDPLAGLDHLAREVQSAGIKSVTGDVIVDDRLFEAAESTGSGPARVSPVLVNDNLIDVVATPAAKAGEPAILKVIPETEFATMEAQVETVAEGEKAVMSLHSAGPRRFSVRGKLPVGHKAVVKVYEVEEPAAFARTVFIARLRKHGVHVRAIAIGDNAADSLPLRDEVAKLPKVAEYVSPPFREYARVILKVSHNLHASTLPLLIAARHGERTLHDGLRREGALLKGLGLDPQAIAFGGGAGGARADLVTPRAAVTLLRAMAVRPDFAAYDAALPVLGRDGTLAKAVAADSPARGHVRAKTGTYWVDNALTGKAVLTSKALAGYMETAAGRPLVFAFFVNNVSLDASGIEVSEATNAAGRLLGKLCEVFYSAGAGDASKAGS